MARHLKVDVERAFLGFDHRGVMLLSEYSNSEVDRRHVIIIKKQHD